MAKSVEKGTRKASATVDVTKGRKKVSAVSRGGSGVAAGRNATVARASEHGGGRRAGRRHEIFVRDPSRGSQAHERQTARTAGPCRCGRVAR